MRLQHRRNDLTLVDQLRDREERMTASYDSNNIFARILRGELPAYTVYEDADTFAFMDIMPRGVGHCLIVPRKPATTAR